MTRGGYVQTVLDRKSLVGLPLRTEQDRKNILEELTALGWKKVHDAEGQLIAHVDNNMRYVHVTPTEAWWSY